MAGIAGPNPEPNISISKPTYNTPNNSSTVGNTNNAAQKPTIFYHLLDNTKDTKVDTGDSNLTSNLKNNLTADLSGLTDKNITKANIIRNKFNELFNIENTKNKIINTFASINYTNISQESQESVDSQVSSKINSETNRMQQDYNDKVKMALAMAQVEAQKELGFTYDASTLDLSTDKTTPNSVINNKNTTNNTNLQALSDSINGRNNSISTEPNGLIGEAKEFLSAAKHCLKNGLEFYNGFRVTLDLNNKGIAVIKGNMKFHFNSNELGVSINV